ncbi:DUF4040 family protein [Natronoglycomyces albus]|uniref:DUF4040 family protein n=1 Tax=Natronoglycomyces albus TaxID=2811108 RepID=A0A895XRA8_9ACTN|nr:DUF4040 family protein [Natronoglycomyces albus]QSB05705.1 DUF4040 family protein [Natronoglycomyces albus]
MLLICVAATATLAAIAPFAGRYLGRNAGWPLAAGLLAIGVLLWTNADVSGTSGTTESLPWMPTLGIELAFKLDGLGLLFSLLVLIIGAAVLAYSARYLGPGPQGSFYGLMTLFAAAMLGLVLADDIIVLFVMWETTTLCSFFLIARSGPKAREPAIRTLLVTAGGGLSLLGAVVVMAVSVGTTNLSAILADPIWGSDMTFTVTVALLIILAAFTKSAQFPFHAWLPDAMAAATPVSAYLHAAAMVKAGIYLLMRFSGVLGDVAIWNILLISCGLLTAILGAVLAMRRWDLKELMAYSTVSQLGFLVAAIGIGTETALIAAAIHTLAHALFKSTLFMFVGIIDHQAGTRDIRQLSGLRHTMPISAITVSLAALSMAGVPPLLGFISKENLFAAFLEAPGAPWLGPIVGGLAMSAAILTFAYSGRIVFGAFGGPRSSSSASEASPAYLFPAVLPALAGLLLGLWPALAEPLTSAAASASTHLNLEAGLTLWHGVNAPLIMSVIVIATGVAMVAKRNSVDPLLNRGSLPFTALGVVDAARAGIITWGARVGDLTRSDSPARHLAIPTVSLVLIAIVGVITIGPLPEQVPGLSRPMDWGLVMIVLIGVIGAMTVRTRIGAVVVVGVVGFGVTLWYFVLGAADVALTQMLVEILTVVVMVLLLRRLPRKFHRPTKRRAVAAGIIALGAGVATTLGVLAMTGRRELSSAGEYFLREGEDVTGGTNVVNTILVDFRAFDTLGELTVLGIAGIAIAVLLHSRPMLPFVDEPIKVRADSPLIDPHDNAIFGRSLDRLLWPVMIIVSLWFLLRGHNSPGGGFISALIGGAGFAMAYITASSDRSAKVKAPYMALIGSGIIIATASGLLGYFDGSFLLPLHGYIFGIHLTTALVFDVGVYLAVIGVVLAALNLLGRSAPALVDPAPPDKATPTEARNDEKELTT